MRVTVENARSRPCWDGSVFCVRGYFYKASITTSVSTTNHTVSMMPTFIPYVYKIRFRLLVPNYYVAHREL